MHSLTTHVFRDRELTRLRSVVGYLTVGLFVACQFVLQGSISLMVPELKADLDMNEAGVGMLASVFYYPYVLLQVPAGWLLSMVGVRWLLAVSTLIMAGGCFVMSVADSAALAMAGRCLMGVGAAPGIVCFLSTVSSLLPVRLFGLFAAGTEIFGMVGAGIGDFLIPEGIRSSGWQGVFEWFGYTISILAFFALSFLPGKEKRPCDTCGRNCRFSDGLTNINVWLVALYSGLMFAVLNAFAALWAIPFLESNQGYDYCASNLAGMIFLGAAVGAPLLGWISDERGDSRGIMYICSALTFLTFLVILYDKITPGLHYPLMFLLGFCSSSYLMPFMMVKRWLNGSALDTGLALTNSISVMVGALLFQPLIGWLLGFYAEVSLDSYRQVLLLIPAGIVMASALLMCVKRGQIEPCPIVVEDELR
ncbi:MFS transporter [Sansalvadorimonas sp. 2012CJ34-2]|uniref:Lysosomal dipeptide transporter MFSD1 n=1 Tax=Parendozoicomonas callyspongiae TaxID=2942213 RepID=A0ABT0PBG6_9GAMM|nr:MFS transporter [Sansalvadorimonas sp. 2012CJ34-2]MCL6268660.1 MFS transporter [Sansalvadorimonas sp. 2012CJ34-2]